MNVEVESRYLVPNRVLFDKLLELRRIGEYRLSAQDTVRIVDYYLDTKGRALLNQGWACRLRSQGTDWLLTLKAPKKARGAIVSRVEVEIPLAGPVEDVLKWPAGEIRDQVSALTGGASLRHLLVIKQQRHRFLVAAGSRKVAELSLDAVRMTGDGLKHVSHMLECELLADGSEADLEALDTTFTGTYLLQPEVRSKLQRGLELISLGRSPDQGMASQQPALTVEALYHYYQVDRSRAEYVTALADQLYEALLTVHQLPESRRALLRTAASLHDIGVRDRSLVPSSKGRGLILSQPIAGWGAEEQRILAAAIYLCRKRVTPNRLDAAFPEPLSQQSRQEALTIAALVRLASALDRSDTETTEIQSVQVDEDAVCLTLAGPWAAEDVERAAVRSDLWVALFDKPIVWLAAGSAAQDREREPSAKRVGLLPTDTMMQAARKILAFHLDRMLEHEEGTRLGSDPEELHDMRVATRRIRSALRLFAHHLVGSHVTATTDGLRRLARVLGEVRDLDVAMEKAQQYLASLPAEAAGALDPLMSLWQRQRRSARRRLTGYLNSKAYQNMQIHFRAMLDDLSMARPEEDIPTSRAVSPFLHLYWNIVLAYDAVLDEAPIELLHALRIDCKRLRYALEFFREILPAGVERVIAETVEVQDHLGDMHDAAVAVSMLDLQSTQIEDPGKRRDLQEYQQARRAEMTRLVRTFPERWKRFTRAKMQRRISALLPKD